MEASYLKGTEASDTQAEVISDPQAYIAGEDTEEASDPQAYIASYRVRKPVTHRPI